MNISKIQNAYQKYASKIQPLAETPEPGTIDPNLDAEKKKRFNDTTLRIAGGMRNLYRVEPYLGVVLGNLKFCIVDENDRHCPTMAVDNYGNIYLNPLFCSKVSDDEFYAIFAHEAMHVVNGTHLRLQTRSMPYWNLATDAIMNWYLVRDGFKLPPTVILPDQSTGVFDLSKFGVPCTINVLNPETKEPLSCEAVYEQLREEVEKAKKNRKKIKVILGKPGQGKGQPGGKGSGKGEPQPGGEGGEIEIHIVPDGTPGSQPLPDGISQQDLEDAINEAIEKAGGQWDKHLTNEEAKETNKELEGDGLTEDQIEKMERQRRDDIARGQQQAEQEMRKRQSTNTTGGRGTEKGGIRDLILKSIPVDPVNWRAVIMKYLKAGRSSFRGYQQLRRNSLAIGIASPGKIKQPTMLSAIFAIDTSGSVGDEQLGVAIEYAYRCAKVATQLDVRIILWHHQAYWCSKTLTSPGALQQVRQEIKKNAQPGGNGMEEIEILMKAEHLDPEVVIYITDGQEGYSPKFNKYISKRYKKLFIIVSSYLTKENVAALSKWFTTPPQGDNPTATESEIVLTPELK